MKKSLLALAVLGAFTGAASAQSSVTLFGLVDLSANRQTSNGLHTSTLDSNQLNSNRLGFKGIEDLGGGLSAGFWLEAGMNNDLGTGAATGGGLSFNRRSTVSLISQTLGEIRAGHDYTPSFWNTVIFDVYGANGIGEGDNLTAFGPQQAVLHSGAGTSVRANNSIAYFLPGNLGGVYGRAMVAPSESTTGPDGQKYYGGILGWAAGPVEIAVGYGDTKVAGPESDYKVFNVGATYDFGFVKIYGLYNESKFDPKTLKTEELSFGIPVGVDAINGSYTHASYSGSATTEDVGSGNQYSIQYLHNFSKRTALYGGIAHISNKGGANFALGDVPVTAGNTVTGYNVGLRHSF
jgi:predicted porin